MCIFLLHLSDLRVSRCCSPCPMHQATDRRNGGHVAERCPSIGSMLSNSSLLSPLWAPILHRTPPCHGFHLLCNPTAQFSLSYSPFFVSMQHFSFLSNVQDSPPSSCRATKGCKTSEVGYSSACICNASLNCPSLSLAYFWAWLFLTHTRHLLFSVDVTLPTPPHKAFWSPSTFPAPG